MKSAIPCAFTTTPSAANATPTRWGTRSRSLPHPSSGTATVAAAPLHHTRSAVLFLSREVLKRSRGAIDALHATKPKRLPTVLANENVRRVLTSRPLPTDGATPLRLRPAADGAPARQAPRRRSTIMVRDGTGLDVRVTIVPNSLVAPLQVLLQQVQRRPEEGLATGYDTGFLPYALKHTPPYANRKWTWHDVFPSDRLSVTSRSGVVCCHHLDKRGPQKTVCHAVHPASIPNPVTPHPFRHSFAPHVPEAGDDIRY